MRKIFLSSLILFSINSFADEVRVIQNGNKVTVQDGSGTTVVQGSPRTAGQALGTEVRVIQNGNKVTVQDGSGTTVVQGSPRTAGQALGTVAKSASELGLGIADAFGGSQQQAPSGRTKVEIKKSVAGEVVENDTVVVDHAKAIAPKEVIEKQVPSSTGEKLSGIYSVNVVGSDGSASSFDNCRDVEIIKDGRMYNESGDQINFTGTVIFTSARGDRKELSGTININAE